MDTQSDKISQQSLLIVNEYQNFLDEFSQTNRKLSYSNERIQQLTGTTIEICKPKKIKHKQTSIDVMDSPCKTHVDTPKNAKSRFKAFGNVVVSIHRLQQNQVEQISSPEQLDCIKSKNKVYPLPTNDTNEILSNLKLIDRFIYYAEQGSDIKNMANILQLDPKRHLRSPSDPNHILNSFNKYGQNSLYIAAKNGHLQVVQFLLDRQANTHIKSKVYENFYESPLEVSIRWNHIACAKTLLERSTFSNAELRTALQLTKNLELRDFIKRQQGGIFTCCL